MNGSTDTQTAEGNAEMHYPGTELEVFAAAHNWQSYWHGEIAPYVTGRVLEVGAGLGTNTRTLASCGARHWTALEPDPGMVARLKDLHRAGGLPSFCKPVLGTLRDIPADARFDAILYADVLEHIEQDGSELFAAEKHLDHGGVLIVLAPAHQRLYSDFDAAIGHFRRYSRKDLLALGPPNLRVERARYLDSIGMLASAANRVLLRSASPTLAQVKLWDRVMVRLSRWTDPCLGFNLGKSVLVVWRKP
jgi:2-polyprenyl-3-methyl-5-hydroxy-6-metoxy-1,4-benzoquinol methylase